MNIDVRELDVMTEKKSFSDMGKEFDKYELFLEAFHDFCKNL